MRTTHLALAVFASSAFAACHVDEPVSRLPTSPCGAQWRTTVDLEDRMSDQGAVVADDGKVVLAAWEDRSRTLSDDIIDDPVVAFAIFDEETGEEIVERTVLNQPRELWAVKAVAVRDGFLVFTFLGGTLDADGVVRGVRVQRIEDDGRVTNDIRVPVTGNNPDDSVIGDDDGATLITFGMDVTRIDAAGNIVSVVHPDDADVDGAGWCTGVARDGDRLVAWCIAFDEREEHWDHASIVTMNIDGDDATAARVPSDGDDPLPVKTARLAAAGDGRFVVTVEDGPRVLAAAVDAAGSIVAGPVEIGSVDGDDELLGEEECTGTCRGLSITEGDAGVVVGYEVDTFGFFSSQRVELVRLALDDEDGDGDTTLAPTASRAEGWAHAHSTATTPSSGALISWIDNSAIAIPWDAPPEKLVVEKSCALP